ncbi:metal-dependent transcriptional regulator [Tepidibacter hydrothermalis]|uniref:Iron dependent repressor, metal binding and dimerization domain protein n=1 Tax=Tepidibacter hydrothermalis TaxID=3036126 RepID=A0ABY8EHK4_9FIRM|nr:iron dependent repressor, metal binding and dimerization domain protein [Tepidibacter hydrothermalis]WFD10992.1 iron dependent repressor, metal binding and dimerization domain protein [Tepidibacter hydrothermalis]
MLSPSLEDYLEEAYRLSLYNKEIRVKDIAGCLNFSMPSVVKGLKKLDELGYIRYRPYEKIKLLDKGNKKGKFLVDRNSLLKKFITIIGANCDINQEAEAMEHYFSIETIKSIEKLIVVLEENEDIVEKIKSLKMNSVLDL